MPNKPFEEQRRDLGEAFQELAQVIHEKQGHPGKFRDCLERTCIASTAIGDRFPSGNEDDTSKE